MSAHHAGGLIVRVVRSKAQLRETFRLRYDIYCAAPENERPSDFRPEDFPEGIERDAWDDYSVHFAAFLDGKIIGTVRLIQGAKCDSGFLMESTFTLPPEIERAKLLEASRIAVAYEARGLGVFHALCKKAMQWSKAHGYTQWCLATQSHLLPTLYRSGWQIQEISGPTAYHGTLVYALILDIAKTLDGIKTKPCS